MLLSVVMTARDTGRFVDAAIASVLDSTHRELELILIDDGSSDRTSEAMSDWGRRDGRVRFESTPPQGRLEALRRGHAAASGDVLAWVDSDDLVDPDAFDLCLGALDGEHEVVYTHRWLIDETGTRRRSHAKNGIEYSPTRLLVSNMVFHLRVFTRNVFERAGGVGELSSAIDWDLNLRMVEHTAVRCVPIELYSYRIRRGRMSGTPQQARNGEAAVRAAIKRRGLDIDLEISDGRWRLRRASHDPSCRPVPASAH